MQGDIASKAITEAEKNLKTVSMVVYCLYFLSVLTGVTSIIGVIIAHIKKGDAGGTIYESHFANQIRIFWIGLVFSIIGILLTFILIGWFVIIATGIWALYRSIKGFLRVVDGKPYA